MSLKYLQRWIARSSCWLTPRRVHHLEFKKYIHLFSPYQHAESLLQVLKAKSDKGKVIEIPLSEGIKKDTVVCFYFAASWCRKSSSFTPLLAKVVEEVRATTGVDLAVVYVSYDSNDASFEECFIKEMPSSWLAIPRGSPSKKYLASRFNVMGIPRLAVVDSDGSTINVNARKEVMEKGAAGFPWEQEEPNRSKTWLYTIIFAALSWLMGYAWRNRYLDAILEPLGLDKGQ